MYGAVGKGEVRSLGGWGCKQLLAWAEKAGMQRDLGTRRQNEGEQRDGRAQETQWT